jgi:hypothetical protein
MCVRVCMYVRMYVRVYVCWERVCSIKRVCIYLRTYVYMWGAHMFHQVSICACVYIWMYVDEGSSALLGRMGGGLLG